MRKPKLNSIFNFLATHGSKYHVVVNGEYEQTINRDGVYRLLANYSDVLTYDELDLRECIQNWEDDQSIYVDCNISLVWRKLTKAQIDGDEAIE